MSDVALLLVQITVHKGKFWVRDSESICYSLDPEIGRDITLNARIACRAAKPRVWTYFFGGAVRVEWNIAATVVLPLSIPKMRPEPVNVSATWLENAVPLMREALELHSLYPLESFTLAYGSDGSIVKLPPDRNSIPPPKGEEL